MTRYLLTQPEQEAERAEWRALRDEAAQQNAIRLISLRVAEANAAAATLRDIERVWDEAHMDNAAYDARARQQAKDTETVRRVAREMKAKKPAAPKKTAVGNKVTPARREETQRLAASPKMTRSIRAVQVPGRRIEPRTDTALAPTSWLPAWMKRAE